MSHNAQKIELSISAVFKIVFTFALFIFLFLIKDILLLFFISLVIVSALLPVIKLLQKLGLPRIIAVILLYGFLLLLVAGVFYLIIPPLIKEIRILALSLPEIVRVLPFGLEISSFSDLLSSFEEKLSDISFKLYDTTKGVFTGVVSALAVVFMSFYLLSSKSEVRG